ncbi:hypothetical protein B0H14DRAFT_2688402 [Mycena olivaceomarginata]|nr:hypothetical protein B0H14DRAFT_2688402 [Mycena olivaceomarginata]
MSPNVAHRHPPSPPSTEPLPPAGNKNIRRHSSASQGIASPVIVAPQRERCTMASPAKKKLKLVSASPTVPAPTALYDFPVRTHGIVYAWSYIFTQLARFGALTTPRFFLPGKYCHAATTASAANPGLNVKGIGILGLPLSERDAKLVQSLIASSTNVTHPVGNVWELDSRSVECSNPAWSTYLEDIVLKDIGRSSRHTAAVLGWFSKSLLLWEASSDILEYECTENPKRMTDEFATIHVILPSFYTGGHVQLSFAGSLENYDLSPSSSFSTSLVAWYHGPVESGRRLALSYRLVTGNEGPRPCLPPMTEKLHELSKFLRNWSDIQEFEPDAAPSIIAYPLLHEYRDNDLRADTLKLEDRHKVIHLKGLCDELGFQLGLATLDDHLIGTADESSNRDGQGRPRMLRVNTRRLTIKEVFDFDGIPLPGLTKLELDEADLVKTVPPLESAPDLVVYESKASFFGSSESDYYRTVVVLFERRRTVEALLHTRRTSYALERLYNSKRKIVAYVLASLYRQQPYNFSAQAALAEIALGWNDSQLWNEVARSTLFAWSLKWLTAWKQFSFEGVRESIEHCCEKKGARTCLEFFVECDPDAFRSVETGSKLDAVLRWSSEHLSKALDTMQHLDRADTPLFNQLIRKKGVMPSITRVPNAYDFWLEFLRSVYALRPEHTNNEEDASTFTSLSDEGLDTILSDFNLVIIDLCIVTRRLDMCRRVLFLTVPRDQGSDWVPDILSPVYIPSLRRTLHDHNIEGYHKPFTDFFRAVIGSGELRRVCGSCSVCAALDDFMVAPKLMQAHFVGTRTHAAHLQTHLMGAADIVSYYSIADTAVAGGNVLIVNKIQDAEADVQWRARKNRALEFLLTIGEMPIIERIMGRRYNDVLLALDGKAHFIHLEDGSRSTGNQSPTRALAIHHLVHGRWVATSLADERSS